MIGFIGRVGRMACSNAIRQIGRQFGREAMDRIMRGEAIEDVLTRDQLRELAKKTGKLALDELIGFVRKNSRKTLIRNKRI